MKPYESIFNELEQLSDLSNAVTWYGKRKISRILEPILSEQEKIVAVILADKRRWFNFRSRFRREFLILTQYRVIHYSKLQYFKPAICTFFIANLTDIHVRECGGIFSRFLLGDNLLLGDSTTSINLRVYGNGNAKTLQVRLVGLRNDMLRKSLHYPADMQTAQRLAGKQNGRPKVLFIIAAVLLGIFAIYKGSSTLNSQYGQEEQTPHEFYVAVQDNELIPYQMNEAEKSFLLAHQDLFPASTELIASGQTDYSFMYNPMEQNENTYGNSLIYLPWAMVIEIRQEQVTDDSVMTLLRLYDGQAQYDILHLAALDNISQGDAVEVYGLPLGISSGTDAHGDEGPMLVIAGSYIQETNPV